ncbi:IDEAL domain-containing protein [Rossellomorea aquimaris]|uniref:IDEAL domain-containing protein n=1 Tax=Rossellomorea aquimaris TaxID=189382 RepID=A0A5D4U3T9_9BACI|nr:IDEAL domain-containing protein [Rossellomorea aquimaris]TYS81928.1 IDEAL domain-containing protein [Rossellomorea aquimaris]TYS88552.1 IDEAL domain-containing protein [Rossellomorea aquimaris]
MKKYLLNSPQSEVPGIDSLFAEMILDKALLTFRKEQLEQKIDQSLRDRNKKEFLRLTEELNQIHKDHEEKDVTV